MSDTIGINENKVKVASRTMLEFRTDLNNILNEFSDIINKTEVYYKGNNADEFRKKYKEFSQNYIPLKNSFLVYSNDFITLVNTYSHENNSTNIIEK